MLSSWFIRYGHCSAENKKGLYSAGNTFSRHSLLTIESGNYFEVEGLDLVDNGEVAVEACAKDCITHKSCALVSIK